MIILAFLIGFNWIGNYAVPPNETPQTALARVGGSVWRAYDNPFTGDQDLRRIRLVRYGMQFQVPNAVRGSMWQLGNEINLAEQDGIARSREGALEFSQWYNWMRTQIKAFDPTAKIIGPSVWNWDGAGSDCCVRGRDSYQWFIWTHTERFGYRPQMDFAAVQIYPWAPEYWNDPLSAVGIGLQQVDGIKELGYPVAVTEWGLLRKPFLCDSLINEQSSVERYAYTRSVIRGFSERGVGLALYYGSHEQLCNGDGYMSWLIERDGSLSVEGQAHLNVCGRVCPAMRSRR